MARPKKDVIVNDNNIIQENENLKNDIETLKEQIKILTDMMNKKSNEENISYTSTVSKLEDSVPEISLNKVIRVMSLFSGTLLLSTQKGGGKLYRFNSIGDIQPIIYADLVQILSNHQQICQEGQFIILDENVVKAHSLSKVYEKMLGLDQIKNILTFDEETIKHLYLKTTDSIRDSIISNIVEKINTNDYVDKNKIHYLSDLCGLDLFAYARGDVEKLINSRNRV